jgi:SAM-dependent methyltransferase
MTLAFGSRVFKLAGRILRRLRSAGSAQLIDPRNFQPGLPLPAGFDRQQIHDALTAVSIDSSSAGELFGYASSDLERFLHTLAMIPIDARGAALEIGANPYFNTLLMRRFRPDLELTLVNYFGAGGAGGKQSVSFPGFDGVAETVTFLYDNVNIETSSLPYADKSFDYVVFCEVLEHMTHDPLRALLELKRVLKPGGTMILTTPNAARLENVVAFLEGRNMYDPFSAYGPYGRHNREYTRHELHLLMTQCGFDCDIGFTANVHPDNPLCQAHPQTLNQAIRQIPHRKNDLGQYLITRWTNVRSANEGLPRWLYRSYPEDRMVASS